MPDVIETAVESGSLSDHEAQWGGARRSEPVPSKAAPVIEAPAVIETPDHAETPDLNADAKSAQLQAEEDARDPNGRFRQKHRAEKDKASPADVPRIRNLTARVKELEAQLAKQVAPAVQTPTTPAPAITAPALVAPDKPFSFPTWDEWNTKNPEKSWDEWNDAKSDARQDYKFAQREAQTAAARQQTEQQHSQQQLNAAYHARAQAFTVSHPDFKEKLEGATKDGMNVPDLVASVILGHDKGPDMLYSLLDQPDEMDRLWLAYQFTPVTDANVVAMQRHLLRRVQTGTTGAVATPPPVSRTPKPPTPVRTGPLNAGTDPPDDGASLAAHEQYFNKPRRR